tara:strand:+ start:1218 stop:2699 length:1482 start_codon:yes stop_codon:yes gene_type:complete
MRLLTKIFIAIFIIIFGVSTYGFNTVRPNEVIFDTGHYIQDDVNTEGGMTSPIPKNVCYKKTLKIEPVECEYTYGQYYTSFATNPVPGTMNIGINVNPDEDAKKLRIMVSSYNGEFVNPPSIIGTIEGFTEVEIDEKVKIAKHLTEDRAKEEKHQGGSEKIPGAVTNLQVGNSLYGESIWIYHDSDKSLTTLGAFESVDWSLEPTVPQPFSINAIRQTNEDADIDTNYYPPGNTYLTDHVLVRDLADTGGQVCINQETALDETGAMAHCPDTDKGMFIKGNVIVGKLFGLVGFVQFRTGSTAGTSNVPKDQPALEVYLDVNMDGCRGDDEGTYPIGDDDQSSCEDADDADDDSVKGFMVSYIGYLTAVQKHQGHGVYWMEVHDGSDTPTCLANPDDALGATRKGVSNTGIFDFQIRYNENASFTFIFVESFDHDNDKNVTRKIKFCHLANTPGSDPNSSQDQIYTLPENGYSGFSYGVAAYGIPVTTQAPPDE